jgi:DNA repair protein SbcD/Mre11
MLTVLHTSDWHLGHKLNGYTRRHEHKTFMAWLLDRIEEHKVDALLIAGDLFDQANPSNEDQQLWNQFLVDALHRRPKLDIVAISGNHDSSARLLSVDPLYRRLRLHIVADSPVSVDDPQRFLVPLHDSGGEVAAWVAAVPFVPLHQLVPVGETRLTAMQDEMLKRISPIFEAQADKTGDMLARLVMMHHTFQGAQASPDSERDIIGGLEGLTTDLFPVRTAYVALGHFHRPQAVGHREWVRYSGTPFPMATNEARYPHQVRLLKFEGPDLVAQSGIDVPRTCDFHRIPAEGYAETLAEIEADIRAFPEGTASDATPFLTLGLNRNTLEPQFRERLASLLRDRALRVAGYDIPQSNRQLSTRSVVTTEEFEQLQPAEVFREILRIDNVPESEHASLLQAFQEIESECRQSTETGR